MNLMRVLLFNRLKLLPGMENIRQNLQSFIDMNGKLETKVTGVIQTSNLALVNIEWSFNGTGPDGNPINVAGKAVDLYVNSKTAHGAF
jgi:ketosteroid isomerase-like protein